jgi:hypothetical protein
MAKAKAKAKKKAKPKAKAKAKKPAVKKVRCAGKTKDGKRCKRMVAPPAKFCHLHK